MFEEHNPVCNAYLQHSPDHLRTGVMMVALSIQQTWSSVGDQMEDWSRRGVRSRYVWGNKRHTHNYLLGRGKDALYRRLRAANNDAERMDILLDVPGLGLAKAGFTLQLWNGGGGCIDIHNIRAYNPPKSLLSLPGSATRSLRVRKINDYLSWCSELGSRTLWDNWCDNLAARGHSFENGHAVSEAHVEYLMRVA